MSLLINEVYTLVVYFLPLLALSAIAILVAKSWGAWIVYGVGTVFHLFGLIFDSRDAAMRGENMHLEWCIYVAVSVLVAVVIILRYRAARAKEYDLAHALVKKPGQEQSPGASRHRAHQGKELRFCKQCGGILLSDALACSRCGAKVE